jgi:hypothetical protein
MKLFVGLFVFVWLLCGVVGAWWLDDMHWRPIVRGPITLVKAFNEQPVDYPDSQSDAQ